MDIKKLLQRKESSKLEFKKEWYKSIDLKKGLEIYKDIISLANGDIDNIGKPSYLIIGVKERYDQKNLIEDVSIEENLDVIKKQILQNVRNLTIPHIINFDIKYTEIENKKIIVIKIPQHPYLIKLRKKIYGNTYREGDVLYRSNEDTAVADYGLISEFERALKSYKNITIKKNKKNPKKLLKIMQRRAVYYTNIYKMVTERSPEKLEFIMTETYKNMCANRKLNKFLFFHIFIYGIITKQIKKDIKKRFYHIVKISSYESDYYEYDILKEEEIIYLSMPHLNILYDDIENKTGKFLMQSIRYLDFSKDMKDIHYLRDIGKTKQSSDKYLNSYHKLIESITHLKKNINST